MSPHCPSSSLLPCSSSRQPGGRQRHRTCGTGSLPEEQHGMGTWSLLLGQRRNFSEELGGQHDRNALQDKSKSLNNLHNVCILLVKIQT